MRKYKKFAVAKNAKAQTRLASKTNLKDIHIIEEDVIVFEFSKQKVLLNKPIFAGMCCLEFAKDFMTKSHYKRMIPYFGRGNIVVLYTDTDSYVWGIYTIDLYKDLINFRDIFDFSYYPSDHPLHNTDNCGVPGIIYFIDLVTHTKFILPMLLLVRNNKLFQVSGKMKSKVQ